MNDTTALKRAIEQRDAAMVAHMKTLAAQAENK